MNKITGLITGSALSILISSCGGNVKPVLDCVFPDSKDTAAPAWICDAPVEGVEVSAVGAASKSGAGHGFMKQMAATDARIQLAQRMKVQLENMIKQYVETTGEASSETVDKVLTSVTKQITNETLIGTKVFKSRTSPAGGLYVLLGMNAESMQKASEKALKTSMNNDNALWQQFKAQKSQDELAADILRMENK